MSARVRRRILALTVFVSSGMVHAEEGAVINPVWLAKVKLELKRITEKYEELAPRLEEESEFHTDVGTAPASAAYYPSNTRRERFARLGDNRVHERIRVLDDRPDQPQIRLECDNDDYHFTLGKLRERSSYALVEYVPGKRKLPLMKLSYGISDIVFSYVHHALASIENDGQYTLRAIRFDNATRLLRIDLTNPADKSLLVEQLTLDPGHDWRVVERRVETSTLIATDRWTYGMHVGGLEFPTESKNRSTYKGANTLPNMETTGRLISLKLTDKTPDDFRLSAFGLPEPADVPPPPKQTPWYLWLVAAAGVCAALSIGFAYVWRRRQNRLVPAALQGGKP